MRTLVRSRLSGASDSVITGYMYQLMNFAMHCPRPPWKPMAFAAAWRFLTSPGLHSAAGQYATASASAACLECPRGQFTAEVHCPARNVRMTSSLRFDRGFIIVPCPLAR